MLKFDGAWTVDEGELVAQVLDVSNVELNAHDVLPGFRAAIADGRALRHAALSSDGAGSG